MMFTFTEHDKTLRNSAAIFDKSHDLGQLVILNFSTACNPEVGNLKTKKVLKGVVKVSTREVNNRLTGWSFAHLVNYFAHPVN